MSTRTRYVAADSPHEIETRRLQALEETSDQGTRRRLSELGIREGWHCLEVGAGRGSVARWMAEQVGRSGRVVAADLDPRFLREINLPNLEVREHDVLARDFERECYDLAHCRALLMHLPKPELALERMIAALRPGGWLLVEEGDFGAWGAVNPAHPGAAVFERATRSIWEFMRRSGVMDSRFGRRVPGLLERSGLTETNHEVDLRVARGGDAIARFWSISFSVPSSAALIQSGVVSQADFERTRELLEDPGFEFLGSMRVAAWGRKAAR